jgi:hypothetical protein
MIRFLVTCLALFVVGISSAGEESDYTRGETLADRYSYWALGATGAIGNLWGQRGNRQTRDTRMIQIRSLAANSPADGVLREGDVIVGFEGDAALALADAIIEAERAENGGRLVLKVWRDGKIMPVTLQLRPIGAYSASAPWECAKTKAIIDTAAQAIAARGFTRTNRKATVLPQKSIANLLDALGLLATGEAQYLPPVRDLAHRVGQPDTRFSFDGDQRLSSWALAYQTLFLAEYFLATGDEYVLPALTEFASTIALGRSGVGTWSHGLADVKANGYHYGPPSAYGAMNQIGITCALSLVLAQECGIKRREIDEAVDRATSFLRWYVDKGCIPYGDHPPSHYYDNHGRNSQAAVLFDLIGDSTAADYFTRMTLASYNQREAAHTGHFFSWLWGALGAARGGQAAAQSFIRNTRWYTELERRHNGESIYQFQLAGQDPGKYRDWSTTGARLLQHCLPRKQLYITGKGGSCIPPILGDDLAALVDAARFEPDGRSTRELMEALGHWSLIVREQAAGELGTRDEDVVEELIHLLASPNRYARYGACVGLSHAGRQSEAAVAALVAILQSSTDMNLRFFAVNALMLPRRHGKPKGLGDAVKVAAPDLLKLAATDDSVQDPLQKIHSLIATVLFYGGRVSDSIGYYPDGRGSESIDHELLVPAVKSLLANPNGGARSTVSGVFAYMSADDLQALWGDIYRVVETAAPSGVMFSGMARTNGLKAMATHHIAEGIPLGLRYVTEQTGWGDEGRKQQGIPALAPYGKALGSGMAALEAIAQAWSKHADSGRRKAGQKFIQLLAEAKEKEAPQLISIQAYLE